VSECVSNKVGADLNGHVFTAVTVTLPCIFNVVESWSKLVQRNPYNQEVTDCFFSEHSH
jgi:hypothetical protein